MNNSGVIGLMLLANSLSAAPLTESETRGKQFYLTGNSAVKARIGLESTELASSNVPCVSCHGEDGRGKPEGGIVPTNITFEYLTLSYGHHHDNGRKHPAFTADSIITAMTSGIDPAGNQLDVAMPRYSLSDSDSADLIAYLKRLANDGDAGLTDSTIRIGTLLPMQGALADKGQAMKAMLQACINELNTQGGIYNRRIELDVAELTGENESTLKNVRRLLETEPVFAMIAPFAGNLEADILALSERSGIPWIAPYTLFPEEDPGRSQFAFYLLPGLNNESRAMVDYAVDVLHKKNSLSMVISPENSYFQQVAKTIEQQSQTRGLGTVALFTEPVSPSLAAQLEQHAPDIIYFFGSDDELGVLLNSVEALKLKPYVFLSASLTSARVSNDKIFLSAPAFHDQGNADEFFQLIKRNKLTSHHLSAQAVSYSAVKLLQEGLQKTGRELSRKKLVHNLEQIYQFDTGLLPPLSYGSNRHIGSKEVSIVPAR